MMYGSTGPEPPTRADEVRFFTSTWRYFETPDRQFESPTPIQGRWKIDGVGLPDSVLRKIYFDNAARVLRWRPPGTDEEHLVLPRRTVGAMHDRSRRPPEYAADAQRVPGIF